MGKATHKQPLGSLVGACGSPVEALCVEHLIVPQAGVGLDLAVFRLTRACGRASLVRIGAYRQSDLGWNGPFQGNDGPLTASNSYVCPLRTQMCAFLLCSPDLCPPGEARPIPGFITC